LSAPGATLHLTIAEHDILIQSLASELTSTTKVVSWNDQMRKISPSKSVPQSCRSGIVDRWLVANLDSFHEDS